MEYICDKVLRIIIGFEILYIFFKTRVVDGIIGCFFFMVYDIHIHQLNLGQFRN